MKISVIVNTYNSETALKRCLNSVVKQSYSDFECLVVDDCSSDQSRKTIQEYQKIDGRISFYRNKTNLGCSLSRKVGLEKSSGEYVVFIDGDDWLESDFLEKMLRKATTENADLVICDYYEENGLTSKYMPQHIDKVTKNQLIAAMASYNPLLVSSLWNKLIKRDLIYKVVIPEERYGEDMYISLQLVYYSTKTAYQPYPLYHYWVNNNVSICNNPEWEAKRRLAMYDICKKILTFLAQHFPSNDLFEPYLSIRMNKTALRIFEDSSLRKKRDAFALYPPAIRYIFRKEIPYSIFKKVRFLVRYYFKH